MINTIKLLLEHLETIHPRVFFKKAPKKVKTPYIVFDLPNTQDDGEGQQVITLDVDGWDDSDTTVLEELMENINTALNKCTLTADTLAVTFYLDTILPLDDDDPRINRWKYIYQARLFERS